VNFASSQLVWTQPNARMQIQPAPIGHPSVHVNARVNARKRETSRKNAAFSVHEQIAVNKLPNLFATDCKNGAVVNLLRICCDSAPIRHPSGTHQAPKPSKKRAGQQPPMLGRQPAPCTSPHNSSIFSASAQSLLPFSTLTRGEAPGVGGSRCGNLAGSLPISGRNGDDPASGANPPERQGVFCTFGDITPCRNPPNAGP
jgi:hypothetical protein